MKNALFMDLVGPEYLPQAKIASIAFLFVALIAYGKLVDWLGKRRLLVILYLVYAGLFFFLTDQWQNHDAQAQLGWGFYLSIESFGSLGVSHLWSLAVNATKDPAVAARRFPMLAVGGQLGAMGCTYLVKTYATEWGLAPLLKLSVALLVVAPVMALSWLRQHDVPDTLAAPDGSAPKSMGLFAGLTLIFSRPYLLSVLWAVMAYEFIGTFLDYQMNTLAERSFEGDLEKVTVFLATYGFWANSISFVFALTGTTFLVDRLGLSRCLLIYPVLLGILITVGASWPQLWVVFGCMIALKGLAYGFNKPCLELLYVPTAENIQFKAKSWIDTAGSRSGKALGSVMNANLPAAWLITGGAAICLALIGIWVPVARRLGLRHAELLAHGEKLE